MQETLTELLHEFSKLRSLHLYSVEDSKNKKRKTMTSEPKRKAKVNKKDGILMVFDQREK